MSYTAQKAVIASCLLSMLTVSAQAATHPTKAHAQRTASYQTVAKQSTNTNQNIEWFVDAAHYEFTQKTNGTQTIKNDGLMYGVGMKIAAPYSSDFTTRYEASLLYGSLNHDGKWHSAEAALNDQTLSNMKDMTLQASAILEYHLSQTQQTASTQASQITPFVGAGFTYQTNTSATATSNDYERKISTIYIPVGAQFNLQSGTWNTRFSAEYDTVVKNTEDTSYSTNDTSYSFNSGSGNGFKASANFSTQLGGIMNTTGVAFEPFVNTMKFDGCSNATCENSFTMYGLKVNFSF